MTAERRPKVLHPRSVELTATQGDLPAEPSEGKGGDDRRDPSRPLRRGRFRPITDPGEPSSVETSDDGNDS